MIALQKQLCEKNRQLIVALLLTLFFGAVQANAELSANIGFASEYYYRGILQKESSASAGLDYTQGGFSAGTWAADVGDGIEVDVVGAYTWTFQEDAFVSVGVAGYYYTGEFDDTYEEVTISAGVSMFSFSYSVGEYDNFKSDVIANNAQDYDIAQATLSHRGFSATVGAFGKDFDGEYIEFGYGAEVGGFDAGVMMIISSKELSNQCDALGRDANGECFNAAQSEALVFTLQKSFEL